MKKLMLKVGVFCLFSVLSIWSMPVAAKAKAPLELGAYFKNPVFHHPFYLSGTLPYYLYENGMLRITSDWVFFARCKLAADNDSHLHYKCSNERADSCRGREEEQCDLCPLWDREKDRDPDFDVYLYSVGKGADGKCRIGVEMSSPRTKVNMYYYGKSESSACGKTEKMEDKTIWVYPDAEEGWDKVNPVFKRKLKAIYDTAHDIQLTATSIYDLELGQLYQQCHLIKVEEERLLYECKKFADFDSFNAEPYRSYVEYKADLYTEKRCINGIVERSYDANPEVCQIRYYSQSIFDSVCDDSMSKKELKEYKDTLKKLGLEKQK